MSKAGCDGVIVPRRCYIRKPGPRSEEPYEAQEWRTLLDRCVRAGREGMLEAIRAIVSGRAGNAPVAGAADALIAFGEKSLRRWQQLIDPLDKDDPARFPHGRYELSFEILGAKNCPSLTELKRRMTLAAAIKHTGWGPFVILHVSGGVETGVFGRFENRRRI